MLGVVAGDPGFIYVLSGGCRSKVRGFYAGGSVRRWGGGFVVVGVGICVFFRRISLSLCRSCGLNGGWGVWWWRTLFLLGDKMKWPVWKGAWYFNCICGLASCLGLGGLHFSLESIWWLMFCDGQSLFENSILFLRGSNGDRWLSELRRHCWSIAADLFVIVLNLEWFLFSYRLCE